MTTQTIYFQKNPVITSIAFFSLGLLQTIATLLRMSSGKTGTFEVAFLVIFILIMVLAIAMFPKFNFSPRVVLTDSEIRIKPEIYNKMSTLNWNSMNKVQLGSYRLSFLLKDGSTQTFVLPRLKTISIRIKDAISETCTAKDIEVERS